MMGTSAAATQARGEHQSNPITMEGTNVKTGRSEKCLGDYLVDTSSVDSVDFTITEIIALVTDIRTVYISPVSTALILWEVIITKKTPN